jgi:hypothetical protein
VTAKDALWPANNVSGRENPDTPKPLPDAAICVTTKLVDPIFDNIRACA